MQGVLNDQLSLQSHQEAVAAIAPALKRLVKRSILSCSEPRDSFGNDENLQRLIDLERDFLLDTGSFGHLKDSLTERMAFMRHFSSSVLLGSWGFVTFAVLYGFTSGPPTVFPPVVIPRFCPSMALLGTRRGMVWAVSAFAYLIKSPIGASVADPSHGHSLGLQLVCGFSLQFGIAMLLAPWSIVQNK